MTSTHANVYMHDRLTGQEHAWSYGNCHHPVTYFSWSWYKIKPLFSSILFSDIQGPHFGILGRGGFEINKQVGKIRSCRLDLIFILFYFSFEFWKRIRKYLLGDTQHTFLPPSQHSCSFLYESSFITRSVQGCPLEMYPWWLILPRIITAVRMQNK